MMVFQCSTDIVFGVDLRAFVNGLMFNCSAYPGMSGVIMELISFEGFSFRSKEASELSLVGKTFEQCSLIWADAVVVGVVDTRAHGTPLHTPPSGVRERRGGHR